MKGPTDLQTWAGGCITTSEMLIPRILLSGVFILSMIDVSIVVLWRRNKLSTKKLMKLLCLWSTMQADELLSTDVASNSNCHPYNFHFDNPA